MDRARVMISRLRLPQVTAWACSWSTDRNMQLNTLRVLRYCHKLIDFGSLRFFSYLDVPQADFPLEITRIGQLDWPRWNRFALRIGEQLRLGQYALSIHEDGFPIDVSLWDPEWLAYDYIGAPWDPAQCNGWPVGAPALSDGLVVGNGGFSLQSPAMLAASLWLTDRIEPDRIASDVFVCRCHRSTLEQWCKLRFAPPAMAARFSTEQTHKTSPSFGFHGRRDSQAKYAAGWKMIEASECGSDTLRS